MIRQRTLFLALVAVTLLFAGVASAGDGGVWVSADGDRHEIHGDHAVLLHDGDDLFDVSELEDGESRSFGPIDKQTTATRSGDIVTISSDATGDREAITVDCQLGNDTCKIGVSDAQSDQVVLMIQKSRTCVNGAGDCAMIVRHDQLSGGANQIIVERIVECDEDGNCTQDDIGDASHNVLIETITSASGDGNVFVVDGGAPEGLHMLLELSDKTTLRCPEGDTTMHVDNEEADDVFLCPQHSQPLEKQERSQMRHKVRMHRSHDDE